MPDAANSSISFDDFEIDTARRCLLHRSEPVPLNAKAFDLLVFLAVNNGRIVSKEEILDRVWNGKFVEESNLVVQMSHLRKALGETRKSPRFLITIPGKGYKFAIHENTDTKVIGYPQMSDRSIEREGEVKPTDNYFRQRRSKVVLFGAAVLAVVMIVTAITLYRSRNSRTADEKPISFSKITASGKITSAAISADGKFAVLSQKETDGESLWLRQMKTGSQTQIVLAQPVEYLGLTISRDTEFVFASVFSNNEIDPKIVRIPILGGVPEQIPNVTTGIAITFSPDEKRFAFTTSNNSQRQTMFGVADVDGTNMRYVLSANQDSRYIPNFRSSPAAWSPDGKSVALGVRERHDGATSAAILSVDPDSGAEKYLTDHRWSYIDYITWIDAHRLAFIATEEEGLRNQIWILDQRTGDRRRITNDLREYTCLSASDTGMLTVQIDPVSSIRIANYEDGIESLTSREVYNGSEYVDEIDWDDRGGIVYASAASGKREIWRMNTDGSGKTQLTSDANVAFGIAVSPIDGSIVFAANKENKRGIWLADNNGQDQKRISEGSDIGPDISSDGRIVFHRGLGYADGIFVTSQFEGAPRLLREECSFPAISPDGRLTACYFMDSDESRKWRIALFSTDTVELIRNLRLPVPIYERQIRFHPSGKYITQIFASGENLKLLMLLIDGSEPTVINDLGKGTSNLPQWSADGRQLLFTVMSETRDAVMLTGY